MHLARRQRTRRSGSDVASACIGAANRRAAKNGQIRAHAIRIPGDCRNEAIRWAPHWIELAGLTRCEFDPSFTKPIPGTIQLVDVNVGKPPRKVADLDGFAHGMQWSRDGKRTAPFEPGTTRLPQAMASGNPRVGVIGESNTQVRLVTSVSIDGGAPEILTPEDVYAYEFRFSPIGSRIACSADPGDILRRSLDGFGKYHPPRPRTDGGPRNRVLKKDFPAGSFRLVA